MSNTPPTGGNNGQHAVDPILHQPLRTQIAAYLAGRGKASFTELKKTLEVTDGNLDAHLKKMIESEYVLATKDDVPGPRQTIYVLSKKGIAALSGYLEQLEKIVDQARSMESAKEESSRNGIARHPKPA